MITHPFRAFAKAVHRLSIIGEQSYGNLEDRQSDATYDLPTGRHSIRETHFHGAIFTQQADAVAATWRHTQ